MKEGEFIAEFGSATPFKFLGANQVTLCRSDGNVIRWKCGKPATCGIAGTESYLAQCSECFSALSISHF